MHRHEYQRDENDRPQGDACDDAVDTNKEETKQLKYRLRLHREEIERWCPTTPGTLRTRIVSSVQKFFLRNDGETWNKWIVHKGAAKNIHDIAADAMFTSKVDARAAPLHLSL